MTTNCCSPACTNPAEYVITELPEEMDSHNEGAHIGDLMCGLHAEHASFYDYASVAIDADTLCDVEGHLDVLIDDAVCDGDEAALALYRTNRDIIRKAQSVASR